LQGDRQWKHQAMHGNHVSHQGVASESHVRHAVAPRSRFGNLDYRGRDRTSRVVDHRSGAGTRTRARARSVAHGGKQVVHKGVGFVVNLTSTDASSTSERGDSDTDTDPDTDAMRGHERLAQAHTRLWPQKPTECWFEEGFTPCCSSIY
jgi:hypothetical protein